jgi:hypothetical protein
VAAFEGSAALLCPTAGAGFAGAGRFGASTGGRAAVAVAVAVVETVSSTAESFLGTGSAVSAVIVSGFAAVSDIVDVETSVAGTGSSFFAQPNEPRIKREVINEVLIGSSFERSSRVRMMVFRTPPLQW